MKFKEILLDFTSLLDIMMIILFWFILNYHNETVKIQKQAESAAASAEVLSAEAEKKQKEADMLYAELLEKQDRIDVLLSDISKADERKSANIQAIDEFRNGISLTAKLFRNENDEFIMKIYNGSELNEDSDCTEISAEEFSVETLCDIISKSGYDSDDAVLFELIYDNQERGSFRAVQSVDGVFDEAQNEYPYLYYRKLKIEE